MEAAAEMMAALGRLMNFTAAELYVVAAVFARVGAVAGLLPGFGERAIPLRVKLAGALAFTAVVWPAVSPALASPETLGPGFADAPQVGQGGPPPLAVARLIAAEAVAGLVLGLAIRMFIFALQLAGSIAAQSTSIAQIFGGGVTPDPMPAIGGALTLGGIAFALAAGLHIKAALAMIDSYRVLPFGVFPVAGDLGEWGVARAANAFALGFSLAAPFVVAAVVYNVAIGAINRAMPQLMVAFIGAPAITGAALLILFAAGPTIIAHWSDLLDAALAAPFGRR